MNKDNRNKDSKKDKGKIVTLLVVLLFFICGCITWRSNFKSQKYTLEQYNKIYNGMKKDDMINILGQGEELANSTIGDVSAQVYSYKNNDGSNMMITVQNYEVASKAQSGLKNSGKAVKTKNNADTMADKDSQPLIVKSLPVEKTIKGVTVRLKKVSQDSDSLKIYVNYINKSNKEVLTSDEVTKIIANGTKYEYDTKFNVDRYYDKNVPRAPITLQPNASADSVIFFKPISNEDKINIVISTNLENYKFNNVKIQR